MKPQRFTAAITLLMFTGLGAMICTAKDYPDPEKFEASIKAFEAEDAKNPPPTGEVVFAGSSSIRMWHGKVHDDMQPLTVIARGFGGSNMNDLLHFADRIILPYKPRALVIYEGDNDISQGISAEKVAATFQELVEKVRTELPELRIYFIAIKPSIARWKLWPEMEKANALIAAKCEADENMTYLDIATPMLTDEGNPQGDLFIADNLHLSRKGYELWRDIIRPVLLKKEAPAAK